MNEHSLQENAVVNPAYYKSHPSGVECVVIAQEFPFCVGSALKYLWRAGLKAGADEIVDLKKARRYIDFEIARRERDRVKVHIIEPAAEADEDALTPPAPAPQPILAPRRWPLRMIESKQTVTQTPDPATAPETRTFHFRAANPSTIRTLLLDGAPLHANTPRHNESQDDPGDPIDGVLFVADGEVPGLVND